MSASIITIVVVVVVVLVVLVVVVVVEVVVVVVIVVVVVVVVVGILVLVPVMTGIEFPTPSRVSMQLREPSAPLDQGGRMAMREELGKEGRRKEGRLWRSGALLALTAI